MAVREVSIYTSRAEKKGDIGGGEGTENEEGEERRKEKKRETHVDRVRMDLVRAASNISHIASEMVLPYTSSGVGPSALDVLA